MPPIPKKSFDWEQIKRNTLAKLSTPNPRSKVITKPRTTPAKLITNQKLMAFALTPPNPAIASTTSSTLPTQQKPASFTAAEAIAKAPDSHTKRLLIDLNSPSASARSRAISALKDPEKRKRYSMFDIAYEKQELVTEEDRKAAAPKTIQEVMRPVVAYVEVRSGDDDRTEGIKRVLAGLGATINEKLYKNTTHVIFKEGLVSSYQKAKKMGIPIVSVLWIEACKKHLILADTTAYPINNVHRYEFPEQYKRMRRRKTMTPSLGEDIARKPVEAPKTSPRKLFEERKEENPSPETISQTSSTSSLVSIASSIEESALSQASTAASIDEESAPSQATTSSSYSPQVAPIKPKENDEVVDLCTPPTPIIKAPSFRRRTTIFRTPKTEEEDIASAPHLSFYNIKSPEATPKNRRRTLYTPSHLFSTAPTTTPTPTATPQSSKPTQRRTLYTPTPAPETKRRVLRSPQKAASADRRRTVMNVPTKAISKRVNELNAAGGAQATKQKLNQDENSLPRSSLPPAAIATGRANTPRKPRTPRFGYVQETTKLF